MRYKYTYFLILLSGLYLSSCRPDTGCRQEETIRLKLLITADSISSEGDTLSFTLDSITVQGVGTDSILYNNSKSVSSLLLPLRKDTNQTRFSLLCNENKDELIITHQNSEMFISLACGCFVNHTIDDITHSGSLIDKIDIVEPQVVNYQQDNAKIHLLFKN